MPANLGEFPIGFANKLTVGYDSVYAPDSPTHVIQRYVPATGYTTVQSGAALTLAPQAPFNRALGAFFTTSIIGTHVVTFATHAPGELGYQEVVGQFEMVDSSGASSGTHGAGRIIAVHPLEKPEVRHLVWQTSNGDLVARQNAS